MGPEGDIVVSSQEVQLELDRLAFRDHSRQALAQGVLEQKMAEVLCVYREVQVLKRAAAKSRKAIKRVAIVS